MDLFHFSMQQLAPPPAWAGDEATPDAHDFFAAWLRHHHYLAAGKKLHSDLRLFEDLSLDALARRELVSAMATYYDVFISDAEIPGLATIRDVERCLTQQIARAAA